MLVTLWLVRHARWLLAGSVFAGVALPDVAAALRPLLAPVVVGLMVLSMARLDWLAVLAHLRRTGRLVLVLAWLLIGAPLLAAGATALAGLPPGLAASVVLLAAAGPILSSPAFATLLGLDAPLALVTVVTATLLVPLAVPWAAAFLVPGEVDVSAAALAVRLSLLVFGSTALALLLRALAGPARMERWAPRVDAANVLLLVTFAILIMDGVRDALESAPGRVIAIAGLAFFTNLALQAVAAVLFRGWGGPTAATLALVSGNRNIGVLLAAMPAAPPDFALFVALVQFPIYVLPALLAPVYRAAAGKHA